MNGSTEKIRLIAWTRPKPTSKFASTMLRPQASKLTRKTWLAKTSASKPTHRRQPRPLQPPAALRLLEDGTLWNQQLITEGAGFAYTQFPFAKKPTLWRANPAPSSRGRPLASCQTTTIMGDGKPTIYNLHLITPSPPPYLRARFVTNSDYAQTGERQSLRYEGRLGVLRFRFTKLFYSFVPRSYRLLRII